MSEIDEDAKFENISREEFAETVARYGKALALIAGHAGKTLISTEHGQPYSIGANAAFEDMAAVARDALRLPTPSPQ